MVHDEACGLLFIIQFVVHHYICLGQLVTVFACCRELELNHNNNMDNSLYDYKNNLSSSYHKSWDKTRQFDVDVEQDEVSDIWLLLRNVCLSLKPDVIELENAACDGVK